MKRYYTLLLIALLASCIQEPVVESDMLTPNLVNEPESEEPSLSSDSVLVSLKTNLDFNSEPMTKASTLNDLYGIRVYQIGNDASARCIAYGTFDDMDKVVIKLAKASKYGIDVTYIPNGKNLVHRYSDGHYGVPFDVVSPAFLGLQPNGANLACNTALDGGSPPITFIVINFISSLPVPDAFLLVLQFLFLRYKRILIKLYII